MMRISGRLAQLGERHLYTVMVGGSIPSSPISFDSITVTRVDVDRSTSARGRLDTMHESGTETRSRPVLLAAEPQLFVADVEASCAFYTTMLGFAVAFTYGEPAFYAQVFRDGARLNLRQLDEPAISPALRKREQLLSASITLADAEPLYLEFQAAGVSFAQALKTEPWGARTFVVCDRDGNLLLFAA